MSLLLAILPVEGLSFSIEAEDNCASCRCCVQPNTNPAPVRNAPAGSTQTVRVDRAARIEPEPIRLPTLPKIEILSASADCALLRVPSVPLFERHCSLLI